MKHGRRHNKLKEQTYRAFGQRKMEGYHRPYRPMEEARSNPDNVREPAPPEFKLGAALDRRSKKRLAWLGIDADEEEQG